MTNYKDGSFGYIMDLFPSDYTPFTKILMAKPGQGAFASQEAVLNAALNIINAFRDLHRVGKSYQDINDGGFVINLKDGDVFICDCDNVAPDEINLGIAGKPGYMAPEIVMGKSRPNIETDNYSLANILFRLLMRGDPFAGALDSAKVCLTEKAERELYGENPVFIYHPEDKSNRPVKGVHNNVLRNWLNYPDFIKYAFVRAFVTDIKNPVARMTDNEWQKLFVRLKGELITCLKCWSNKQIVIASAEAAFKLNKAKGSPPICPVCGQTYPMPMEIAPNGFPVLLFPGVKLFQGHTHATTTDLGSEDYLSPTGVIITNPQDPNKWGITNRSDVRWYVREPGKERRELEPGKTVAVAEGLEIEFPNNKKVVVQK
jgi:serine/threonine protein kinase